jgi:prepilin-type N-terminal cleavage/methylation domain-containing protein
MINILGTAKGMTLVELLVGMSIFSLIVAGIISSKLEQQDQHISQLQAVEMQQSVRAVMFLIKKEIRMAGFDPFMQDNGAGIIMAEVSNLSFSIGAGDDGKDNDGDGQVDEYRELETIAYAFSDPEGDGDDMTVSYNGAGAQVIAENILNLNFSYYDANGVSPGSLADIKSVQITITTTTDVNELARTANNNTRTLNTSVYLRNMGL